MSAQLKNHLRANRKRCSLSQEEVAFLLGRESGAKVCRYERFKSEPSLEAALAFEVIYQQSLPELFAGIFQRIEKEVADRAKSLMRRPAGKKPNWHIARRMETLQRIAKQGPEISTT